MEQNVIHFRHYILLPNHLVLSKQLTPFTAVPLPIKYFYAMQIIYCYFILMYRFPKAILKEMNKTLTVGTILHQKPNFKLKKKPFTEFWVYKTE